MPRGLVFQRLHSLIYEWIKSRWNDVKLAGLMEDSGDWDFHFSWIWNGQNGERHCSWIVNNNSSDSVRECFPSILEAWAVYEGNSFDLTARVESQSRNSRQNKAPKLALPLTATCFKRKVKITASCCGSMELLSPNEASPAFQVFVPSSFEMLSLRLILTAQQLVFL